MGVSKFFRKQILVARVYGIPVRIDYRWFVVFGLSVWLIGHSLQLGPHRFSTMMLPALDLMTAWVVGVITTLLLFLSVFGHELSHALMGRAEGIEIEEIVLHPFGGFTRLKREADNPRAEFRIAIAGPAASFLFGVLAFVAAYAASVNHFKIAAAVFSLVGSGNILLAVFNLFPGYPLDGGRVLRALLWRSSGNIVVATRVAGFCGIFIAATLIIFGIYMAFTFARLTGLWAVLVGLFLLDAAIRVVSHSSRPKQGVVADAMGAPVSIEPDVLMSHFVDQILPMYRQTSFPVAHDRRLHGMLTLADLKKIPRERWRNTRARDIMRPIGQMLFVEQDVTLAYADDLMRRNGIGALAIVDNAGQLVGFLQQGVRKKVRKKKVQKQKVENPKPLGL
ncbi:MAG TPA: site-2 protease family protein [Pyrinomonadaceae bacterium]|nr:site-2 protease family protein [Pyrinomonadaceae bacterium]